MGWQIAAGDREWEIIPMLKPILIGFTLIHWTGFVNLIKVPFEAIAEYLALNSNCLSASPIHVFFKNYKFYQNTFGGNWEGDY